MSAERAHFCDAFRVASSPFAFDATDAQVALMWSHFSAMCAANRQFNLTRITDAVEAAIKHYVDSLLLSVWANRTGNRVRHLLDVGTGAGFPAVPLAIVHTDWQVTAIDSTAKKAAFLAEWITGEKIPNMTALHARAEHWTGPERFDMVTFRATGSLAKCLTQARGVLTPRGLVVCFKSRGLSAEENADARRTAKALGFHSEPSFDYDLNCQGEPLARQLVMFRQG